MSLTNRLVDLDRERWEKYIFEWDYMNGGMGWCKGIQQILERCNLCGIYHAKGKVDIEQAKNKLFNAYKNDCKVNILKKPKLRTFQLIKDEPRTEKYVTENLTLSERSFLSQLRFDILPFHIETGRFVNTSLNERICNSCNLNLLEDEFHLIFDCPVYNQEREVLFNYIVNKEVAFLTLSQTFQLKIMCEKYFRKLSKFLQNSWSKRQTSLYELICI